MHESSKVTFFDSIAARVLGWMLALLPLFFIPFLGLAPDVVKTYLIVFGILILLCIWIIARMMEGHIAYPKSPTMLAMFLIPVAYFVSALFSPVSAISFGGVFLPIDTVFTLSILALVFFGSVLYIKTEENVKSFFKSLSIVFFIISLLEILHLLLGSHITLGALYSPAANLIGHWNDLGIYYGGAIIAALAASEFLSLKGSSKWMIRLMLVISLFFLIVVNFLTAWIVVGFFSLIIFVYSLTVLRHESAEKRYHFPVLPFVTLLVALLFILANGAIGGWLPRVFGIFQTDVRPSVQTTASVAYQALKQHPLVGVGPDRFNTAWLLYQPKEIALTQFWNTPFVSGFGFLPSVPVVAGLLGLLAFLAFIILFALSGFLHAFRVGGGRTVQFSMFLSFLLSCYGWIFVCIYNPGIVVFALTIAFSGIFVGLLNASGLIPTKTQNFLDDPRKSFFSILLLVLILVGSLGIVFVAGKKFTSLVLYARANTALAKNDVASSQQLLSQAISFEQSDMYYQGMVVLDLSQLNALISNTSLSQDTIKAQFKNIFSATENDARAAITYDNSNPENWITLGSVYGDVLPFGVTGAYDNAKASYEAARKLMPNSPRIDLLEASLELANKNTKDARPLITAALAKKANSSDAYLLLAEVDITDGDQQAAITDTEQAAQVDPNNPNVLFQLGVLKYKNADYSGAVSAFEQASILDQTSLTSRYYLGLSYEKAGRTDDEAKLFHGLAKQLPDNDQLKKIVANLDAGKSALDGLVAADQTAPVTPATPTLTPAPASTLTPIPDPKKKTK